MEIMFKKLNRTFETPIYAITHGLKTFTGENTKGIDYKKIWSPEANTIYSVLPERYWNDFHLTRSEEHTSELQSH